MNAYAQPQDDDYVWVEPYQSALIEADDKKLPLRIQAAQAAIDSRLHELQQDHGGTPDERQAMADALQGLSVLRRELETRAREK
jgi:hypothetical protein